MDALLALLVHPAVDRILIGTCVTSAVRLIGGCAAARITEILGGTP